MKHIGTFAGTFLCVFLLTALSAYSEKTNNASETGLFGSVFITDSRINILKQAVAAGKEPASSAFAALRQYADKNLYRSPIVPKRWYVPFFYINADGHMQAKKGLQDDANAAYALALCYRMTDEKKYAEAAIRLINAWTTGMETMSRWCDSMLCFSYHFPAMIFAADLLRNEGVWPQDQQKNFSGFLQEKACRMNTMARENNWGNWGLVLASSCAVYQKDETLFKKCVERWKYFIEHQVADDGRLPREVKRSGGKRGIWYSHFCLMPQTLVAEILRVNGVDLFDYKSPQGHTLKQAFFRIASWTETPATFPYWKGDPKELRGVDCFSYFEILNAHWPNDSAAALLIKARPMSANHSAPFLTFTHGNTIP